MANAIFKKTSGAPNPLRSFQVIKLSSGHEMRASPFMFYIFWRSTLSLDVTSFRSVPFLWPPSACVGVSPAGWPWPRGDYAGEAASADSTPARWNSGLSQILMSICPENSWKILRKCFLHWQKFQCHEARRSIFRKIIKSKNIWGFFRRIFENIFSDSHWVSCPVKNKHY